MAAALSTASASNGHLVTSEDSVGRPLKVIVVGGGIASLVASTALRQQGHHVEIYEKSRFANEAGAAIHCTPNATTALRHLGIHPQDRGAVPLIKSLWLNAANGPSVHQQFRLRKLTDGRVTGQPWLQAHRAQLHKQLKEAATSNTGRGTPCQLHTSSAVVAVDPQNATVTLASGETKQADLIVGGDGVHSVTRRHLGPNTPTAFKTSHHAFRFTFAKAIAMADPVTRPLLQDEGTMCAWYGADRKIVLYATSYNTLLNFVCIHPASSSEDSDDYNKTASKSRLLEVYAGFHPAVISLLEKVGEDQVSLYTLYDMEQLPTFVTGLMALIGDAAHPFTPHLAQGGAMAIEDGLSLGTMLPLGTLPEEVQVRLQLYNQARHERASKIQEYSRIVGGDSAKAKSTSGASLAVHEFIDYGLSHDEYYASRQILRKHLWKQPSSQQRWRSPLGFGLLQGPRQDLHGRSHAASLKKSASRHASIQFATSASVLRGLFPSDRYTFMSRDTVQHVTLDLQTLDNMSWLGGQGYDLVALYIHGVCYQEADGTLVQGKYCPIMIENLADPIITGREEVGIPKVFSDIAITDTETSVHAIVSWRGTQWLQLEWSQLSNASVDTEVPAPGREGILVHKYVPSTAKPGTADVEYAVLIDSTAACSRALSRQECLPSNATVSFSSPGAKALPTLCNIAEALAELPVYKSLQASVLKVEGVSDFSNLTVLH